MKHMVLLVLCLLITLQEIVSEKDDQKNIAVLLSFVQDNFLSMQHRIEALERSVTSMRHENDLLRKECIERFSNTGNHQQSKDKRLLMPPTEADHPSDVVAFSAQISHGFNKDIGPLHPFIFDVVETNNGNCYNNFTGVFTAPVNGVYVFAWTIDVLGNGGDRNGELSTELMVNGNVRGHLHADTETMYDDDSATGVTVVNLQQNDIVYVRSAHAALQGDYRNGWTFSGWKL